jgi:hypothetical protein
MLLLRLGAVNVPSDARRCRLGAAPNTLWWAAFKGEFELGNGRYCYPLAATNLRPPGAFKLGNGVLVTFCQPCLRVGHRSDRICLERAKGFEPSTPTLARLCSTPELHPHPRTAAAAS